MEIIVVNQLDRGILIFYPQKKKEVHRKNRANFAVNCCLLKFSSSVYSIQFRLLDKG